MNNRARRILNMVVTTANKEESDNDDIITLSTQYNMQQYVQEPSENSVLQHTQYDTLSSDSFDTNSIPDSQHYLEFEDDVESVIGHPNNKMPSRVVEQSDSFGDSSSDCWDSDGDSATASTTSAEDFSSDDSVKDPNFLPGKRYDSANSSDSKEDTEPKLIAQQYDISPQPGPSGVRPQLFKDNILSHDINTQPPSIDTSVNTDIQSPSVDSQPPSVDDRFLSRKRKANPETWKRNRAKFLRNSGKAYTSMSKSKKLIDARKMGPVCKDSCKLKCPDKFPFEQRFLVFKDYWQSGDLEVQRQFVNKNMSKIVPKYRYVRDGSTRNMNHAYYLPRNSERIRVCKFFFMNTLAISDKTIRTVVKKYATPSGIQIKDNRGKHGKQPKLEASLKDDVKAHINSIPRIESHYCRARTKREFIEGSLSIASLHRDYVDKCKTEGKQYVSYQIYYNIFVNDFNISFWQPKKDQCEDCTAFVNSEDKTLLQEKYDLHLKEKNLVRAEKEEDKKKVSEKFTVCVYDLQAVMPCPQGEVSSFYYISKLNLLNFTVTELGTNNTNCFVWHEGEGGRGVNEIGSCVLFYLKNLNNKATDDIDVVFYSDNCCGQQKNKFMLAMYQYAIKEFAKLRSITHKFLIKGHTQNEGDDAHSLIQRNISRALKSSPIYVPDQYITLIKTAKKKGTPFTVHELTHESFLDLKSLAIGNYTTTEDGQKVKWSDIKVLRVHRDYENKFFLKTSYESEEFVSVSSLTKRLSKSTTTTVILPKKLYNQKLKIAETKKQGILKLIEKNIIPKYYKSFYENL